MVAFVPGGTIRRKGYFTQALWLRMQTANELEKRLGYGSGRLADGWWLLLMTELPAPSEFEYRGYTHLPRGVVRGHLPERQDYPNAEQRLRDNGMDLVRLKRATVSDQFCLIGPKRLAKVVPRRSHCDADTYPPGTGVPQWELVRPKLFRVAEEIAPGAVYSKNYI